MIDATDTQPISSHPFLTIGIASYNYAPYLPRAFEQIKKQSFRDFEILYCDDGSTDHSQDCIRRFIRENPDMQIRLIEGKNAGILANRNRILEHARGTYLMICDADDYMLDNCLTELCSAACAVNADCVIGGFEETDSAGHILKRHIPSSKSSKWLYTWHHAQIYKTALVRQNGIYFEALPDDVFFLQQIHLHSRAVAFVDKPLYAWIRHTASTSTDIQRNPDWNPAALWQSLSGYITHLQQKVPDAADRQALCYYLYKWFYFNICDLPLSDWQALIHKVHLMQKQMAAACPCYRQFSCLWHALHTNDTFFARTAVFLCWILEKPGMLVLLPVLRTTQQRLRNLRRGHAKT